jgi:hypothetical protein
MPEKNDDRGQTETQRLAEAIEIANIPVLLMMLVQLTGNLRWLDDNYRTRRARGMNDNDTGGHPEAIVAEIRAAALEAIVAWRAGRPVAIPEPSRELRLKMLSVAMGEEILDEYDSIIAEELSSVQDRAAEKLPVPDGFGVVIIGAGVSGLCAAGQSPAGRCHLHHPRKEWDGGRNLARQPLSRGRCRYAQPPIFFCQCSVRLVHVLRVAR